MGAAARTNLVILVLRGAGARRGDRSFGAAAGSGDRVVGGGVIIVWGEVAAERFRAPTGGAAGTTVVMIADSGAVAVLDAAARPQPVIMVPLRDGFP
ncbi:hypothetical protein ACQPZQ_38145 [Pseudonocardia sp. CA-142604]|uniref:hypothetical protein n=1 Tax=Pseudonocardia sp. CA-142604 TaxID=3240024 RepID=UPI003D907C76